MRFSTCGYFAVAIMELQSISVESLQSLKDTNFNVTFSPSKAHNSRRLTLQATRNYLRRFSSILTGRFEDEESWWLAAEALLEEDEEFAEKVGARALHACSLVTRVSWEK